jgi:hypothetical protein
MALISNGSTIFDNGSMASGFGGSMTFIKKLTASASATLSFVDGTDGVVLDDTYKEYVFTFKDIHPATNRAIFGFNLSTDSGSNYNVTKTTTAFIAFHSETNDADVALSYDTGFDLAQSTADQRLTQYISSDGDSSASGNMSLFNPASTTYVKHFISSCNNMVITSDLTEYFTMNQYVAGYGNTTSAVDAIRFQFSSGNIDAGDICLYGIA